MTTRQQRIIHQIEAEINDQYLLHSAQEECTATAGGKLSQRAAKKAELYTDFLKKAVDCFEAVNNI
jgi:hypothetical protein